MDYLEGCGEMIPVSNLSFFVDERIVKILEDNGFTYLYNFQFEAIKRGLANNIIVNIPTGGGKTLVAEVLMIDYLLKNKGKKVVYVAPLRSLVREKWNDFKKWYPLGIRVGMAMGDYWLSEGSLNNKDIIVTTYPKFVSLINHRESFLDKVGMIVIDEFHTMSPEIEIIGAFAKMYNWRVVALSATVGNIEQLADWLDAVIYRSADRPIKLSGGIVLKGNIIWMDGRVERKGSNWIDVVKDFVLNGLSVLVFTNGRRKAEKYAKMISMELPVMNEDVVVQNISDFVDMVRRGVMFHHAGLNNKERSEVEDLFRSGILRVLVATKTLAMGVNLPADVVLIKDVVTIDGKNVKYLDVMDVWQMLGRAGRKGKSKVGIGLIYAGKKSMVSKLIDRYFEGKVEDARPSLFKILSDAVVSFLAYKGRATMEDILDFVDCTYTGSINDNVLLVATRVIDTLQRDNIIRLVGDYYVLTDDGKLLARLFISKETFDKFKNAQVNDIFDVLWNVVNAKEFSLPKVSKNEYAKYEHIGWIYGFNVYKLDESTLSVAKAIAIIMDWIDGAELRDIEKKYKVGYGDLKIMLETAEWLSYAIYKVREFYKLDGVDICSDMVWMVKYGVPRELVPFVKRRGIGRKRAFQLFEIEKAKRNENKHSQRGIISYWVMGGG